MNSNKWTKKEEEKLVDMKANNATWLSCSTILRKSIKACRSKHWKIMTAYTSIRKRSFAEDNRLNAAWRSEEDASIRQGIRNGDSIGRLVLRLRRNEKSIKIRIKKLERQDRKNNKSNFGLG